jgi:putative ABC transport system permease protein
MNASELWRRLLFLWRRNRMAEELEEEMQVHAELRANRLREQGIDSQEAFYGAQRQFGNRTLLKEVSGEMWGWMWLERLLQDFRFALRMLRKNAVFSIVAIATLALGAGANALMFTVIDSVLLRPLPYKNSRELVFINTTYTNGYRGSTSLPNFVDMRAQNQSFSAMAAYQEKSVSLRLQGGEPIHSSGAAVSANLFDVLAVYPMLGPGFLAGQDQPGKPCTVVLSAGFWREHFSRNSRAIGQNLTVDGQACTISGVMADGFAFPSRNDDFWIPLQPTAASVHRGMNFLDVIARLKSGVGVAVAQTELTVIAQRLEKTYPDDNKGAGFKMEAYQERITGDVRPALFALLGAVSVLLLIACANIANLQMARALGRKREMAIRSALGAGRMRVARQLFTENIVLALIGTGAGLALAASSLGLLRRLAGDTIPRVQEIHFRSEVYLAMLLVGGMSALLFGLAPIWHVARQDIENALRESAGTVSSSRKQQRFRDALVVAQLSLAIALLAGSGLLLRTLYHLLHTDPGFVAEHVLSMQTAVSGTDDAKKNLAMAVYGPELDQIEQISGVKAAGFITFLPLSNGHASASFLIKDRPSPNPETAPHASLNAASDDYFRALGIALIRGRFFMRTDTLAKPRVAIVNDALAKRYFDGENPVGKQIAFDDSDFKSDPITIIGVVRGSRQSALASPPDAELYLDFRQVPPATPWSEFLLKQIMSFVVRTSGDPNTVANDIQRIIHRVDRAQTIFHVETMENIVSESVRSRRLGAILLSVFAGLALVVAAAGLYGVLSFIVTQRTRDIAIRMALGALQGEIVRMVVGRAVVLYAIGLVAGLTGVIWCGHLLSNMLAGIQPADPLALGMTTATLLLVSFLAAWFPARRAASVDLYFTLRAE